MLLLIRNKWLLVSKYLACLASSINHLCKPQGSRSTSPHPKAPPNPPKKHNWHLKPDWNHRTLSLSKVKEEGRTAQQVTLGLIEKPLPWGWLWNPSIQTVREEREARDWPLRQEQLKWFTFVTNYLFLHLHVSLSLNRSCFQAAETDDLSEVQASVEFW